MTYSPAPQEALQEALQAAIAWVIDCWGIDAADCLVYEADVIALLEREYAGGLVGFVRDELGSDVR